MPQTIYIFLDEGGDLSFTLRGSEYFTLTSAAFTRPFNLYSELDTYKYDIIEYGINIQHFHCCEDTPYIRQTIFDKLSNIPTNNIRIDSLIVEKRKTGPALQEYDKFYPYMLRKLLSYVMDGINSPNLEEVIIITDTLPQQKKKKAIEKAIKLTLARLLPSTVRYRIYHHSSKAHYGLQIADYCNWAVLRKWARNDSTHYNQINHLIKSEFDIFRSGRRHYY